MIDWPRGLVPGPYPAGVVTRFFAAVGRHRRVILVAGMAFAVGCLLSDQLLELGYAPIVILLIAIAWRDTNVQLRPDGLWQRGITGWLVVPWEASPTVPTLPPSPNANTVRLEYGHRDLVRRHGLHVFRQRLRTQDIDPRLITAAIRYYVEHPEHRPAIGTRAEYDRVMPQLLASPAARHR